MSPEELTASAFTFMGLRTVPVAVTAVHDGRTNGGKLGVGEAWGRLGTEWTDEYERNQGEQIEHCRHIRGLPSPGGAA